MIRSKKIPLYPAGLWNVGWRYLLRRPWQSVLMVLGIALGVAVMVAIDLANASASQAFELSTQAVTGKATHQITGGPDGIDEKLYTGIVTKNLAGYAAPVITETVSSPQLADQPLDLLGIDPFVDSPFRSYLSADQNLPLAQLTQFLTRSGAVLISRHNADRYHLGLGDTFNIEIEGKNSKAFVAGILDSADPLTQRTLDGLLLADISTAQELTGKIGRLDRIDLILPADPTATLQKLASLLPAGVTITPASAQNSSIEEMTAAFRLNLTALSLLALLVGLFLIYNTMTFSVVQRRTLFGTLRCLGVTRREIFGLVASEAFLIGLAGSIAGIALGVAMGRETVALVTRTINDLYFTTTVQAAGIPVESLLKGGIAGLVATVVTAAFPAWEAASVPPRAALSRSVLEGKARQATLQTAGVGGALIAAGLVVFDLPRTGLIPGFGGTLAVIVGFALLSAISTLLMMRLVVPVSGRVFGMLGRMAPRNLVSALSRTSVAVAALMVAVAVTIGVTLMIDSFRYTVSIWLQQTLQSDVYISVPGFNATVATETIDPRVLPVAKSWPGVERADSLRSVSISSPQGPIQVSATDDRDVGTERLFLQLRLPSGQVWEAMQSGGVLVTEPLANRLNLFGSGSQVTLLTPQGDRSFPVIGITYDYASSEGSLIMSLSLYRQIWGDDSTTAIGLRLSPGANPDEISRQLQDRLSGIQSLLIRPNAALRAAVMAVFDRTFAITAALRVLATVVAFIGVLNTLLLLQLEKQRETGILRALGLTGRQLWGLTMLETGLMGLAAGLLAIPTGYVLSLILVYVINRRSFGWTLQLSIQPEAFLQAVGIAVMAALLAGIYPAWRMSRKPVGDVIRND